MFAKSGEFAPILITVQATVAYYWFKMTCVHVSEFVHVLDTLYRYMSGPAGLIHCLGTQQVRED